MIINNLSVIVAIKIGSTKKKNYKGNKTLGRKKGNEKIGNINRMQRGNKTYWASKKRQKMNNTIIQGFPSSIYRKLAMKKKIGK